MENNENSIDHHIGSDVDVLATNVNNTNWVNSNDQNTNQNNKDQSASPSVGNEVKQDPNVTQIEIIMDIPRIQWFIIKNDQRYVPQRSFFCKVQG